MGHTAALGRCGIAGAILETGMTVPEPSAQHEMSTRMSKLSEYRRDMIGDVSESRLRLQTIVRLRWFAVAGQLIAVLICRFGFGFELPLGYCLLLIALSAWLNVFLRLRMSSSPRLSETKATLLLGYDIVQLAGLLFLTGGLSNPFIVLLVAPVTVSAATMPLRSTIGLGLLAIALVGLLIELHMPLPWDQTPRPVLPNVYRLGQFAAILATMIFLAAYVRRLASESRQMSQALSATELILAREQRLHALDGLAAAAAHELGTPLATITVVSKELIRALPPDQAGNADVIEDLKLLQTQSERCRDILRKLTKAPSARDPMHARVTIRQLMEEASKPYRGGPVSVEMIDTPGSRAGATIPEPEGERQPGILFGLGNLVENAVDYAETRVILTASWDDDSVSVSIIDDGPGFPPEVLDELGEPYVRSRSAKKMGTGERSGLGLGFFIAKTLLERSGATLDYENREPPETGAVVRVTWRRDVFEQAGA
jgi:two-component system sensor histidine kinase RegB